MSETKTLIHNELSKGMSQSNIAKKLKISRQMVHIVKLELVKEGLLKEKDITKYPKRKAKKFHNSLLHEQRELLNKYIGFYSEGKSLSQIYQIAKEDGVLSVHKSINEAFKELGYRESRSGYPIDKNTGQKLNFLFQGQKFIWNNKKLKLVNMNSVEYKKFKQTLTNKHKKQQNYSIKTLYDEFSKFALISYATWTVWMATIPTLFKLVKTDKGTKYVPIYDFMLFLDKKFNLK